MIITMIMPYKRCAIPTTSHLHVKVTVCVVVLDDIAHTLVEHREQGVQGSQASEVHDVLVQLGGILQAAYYDPVRGEVGAQDIGTVHLDLSKKRKEDNNYKEAPQELKTLGFVQQ